MIQTLQEENRQFRTDISAKYDALVEADREEVLRSKDATSQIEAQVVALTANGKVKSSPTGRLTRAQQHRATESSSA